MSLLFNMLLLNQGSNSRPLQWKHEVLATGPPGNSPISTFFLNGRKISRYIMTWKFYEIPISVSMNSFTGTQPHSFLYNIQQQNRCKSDYKQEVSPLSAATNSGEIIVTKKHFKYCVFCHITLLFNYQHVLLMSKQKKNGLWMLPI